MIKLNVYINQAHCKPCSVPEIISKTRDLNMNGYASKMLTDQEFDRLSKFIYKQCGIKMTTAKKNMVEARLRKRLKNLQIDSYSEYCEFIFTRDANDSEITNMVDVITTNKTDFFREPKQFNFLIETALPTLTAEHNSGVERPLKIWSAGCSSGEEPYTLSIVLHEFAKTTNQFIFNILATDISTRVLDKARLAVYEEEKVEPVPHNLLEKYFFVQ